MSEGYYRDPRFCLECAYQHARDVEHHLEDWNKFTEEPTQKAKAEELRSRQREIRKEIDEWRLKLMGESFEEDIKENPEPYAWTECELAHPEVQRKIISCSDQILARQTCLPKEWGTRPDCVNPFAVCRASIKCP